MKAGQESVVLLSDGAWAGVSQTYDSSDGIFVGGLLTTQELSRSLPQQLSARSAAAVSESVERSTEC